MAEDNVMVGAFGDVQVMGWGLACPGFSPARLAAEATAYRRFRQKSSDSTP
jgi:hypothetical protein